MDNCPNCGREVGIATYSCRVPLCFKARFCSPACICEHMGNHVKERDERIAALEAEIAIANATDARLRGDITYFARKYGDARRAAAAWKRAARFWWTAKRGDCTHAYLIQWRKRLERSRRG